MIDTSYGTTIVHRLNCGVKLGTLFFVSIILFMIPQLWLCVVACFVVYCCYWVAGFPIFQPFRQLKGVLPFLAALFVVQWITNGWLSASIISFRLLTLILLAMLVTLTTPFMKMLEFFERSFSFVRFFGGNPAKISLALSLTLRFIPVFSDLVQDVRDAQKVRGLEKNFFALIMPVLVRSLKMQEDIAAAIEARCYDGEKNPY